MQIGKAVEGAEAGSRQGESAGIRANESPAWRAAYDSQAQVERRRSAIPRKLRKLGLEGGTTNVRILDLCCGNGETLDALYGMGFRELRGADIVIGPDLAADPRFAACVADAAALPWASGSFDWILIVHALHHLGPAERIRTVLAECHRLLSPGVRLAIVDFPNSPQIRLAFWCFRRKFWLFTPYLRYFGKLIQEEWCFLKGYLAEWPRVRVLLQAGPFEIETFHQEFFYYFLTLRKPVPAGGEDKRP